LRNLDKELESEKDVVKEEGLEEVEEREASHESDERGEERVQRVIRFEDGDLENPNNCKPYLFIRVSEHWLI
jgi:hypothetical protein